MGLGSRLGTWLPLYYSIFGLKDCVSRASSTFSSCSCDPSWLPLPSRPLSDPWMTPERDGDGGLTAKLKAGRCDASPFVLLFSRLFLNYSNSFTLPYRCLNKPCSTYKPSFCSFDRNSIKPVFGENLSVLDVAVDCFSDGAWGTLPLVSSFACGGLHSTKSDLIRVHSSQLCWYLLYEPSKHCALGIFHVHLKIRFYS